MKQHFDNAYSVITFATNKLNYTKFALNCAQSVLLFNDIKIYVVSNLDFAVPDDLKQHVFILKIKEEHAALGVGAKLYIDQYLQTENNLFVDADCLCYDSIESIFKACDGKNVTVAGTIVDAADWCGPKDAKVIEHQFGLKQLIRFNGGMYFLKKTKETNLIFEFARTLFPDYDKFGFARLRGNSVNEEILLSIAMMKYGESPIADDGSFMTDLSTDHHPARLNVLTGVRKLVNPAPARPRHRPWYPLGEYSPIILHFGGNKLRGFPYITQYLLLKLKYLGLGTALSTLISIYFLQKPYRLYIAGKNLKPQAR